MPSHNHIKTANELFIEQLYYLHYGKIVNYANHFLRDVETAKEIAQEAIISLWQKRDTLDINGNIEYYLLSTVRNKVFNLLRNRQRVSARMGKKVSINDHLGIIALSDSSADNVLQSELTGIIAKTIESMSPAVKNTFILCREQGLSYKEIALESQISIKTVEYRISKALEALRTALADYLPVFILFYFFRLIR